MPEPLNYDPHKGNPGPRGGDIFAIIMTGLCVLLVAGVIGWVMYMAFLTGCSSDSRASLQRPNAIGGGTSRLLGPVALSLSMTIEAIAAGAIRLFEEAKDSMKS